jgi:hypothetical protein
MNSSAEGIVEDALSFKGIVRGPKFEVAIQLLNCRGEPMPNAAYELVAGSERSVGIADGDGLLTETLATKSQKCTVTWHKAGEHYSMQIFLDVLDIEQDEGVRRRLHNIGYPYELPLAENVWHFRSDQGLGESDTIDSETRQRLKTVYESGEIFKASEMKESSESKQEDEERT